MTMLKSLLQPHILQALGLIALCHIVSIYTVDSPKPIYHCPLDRRGLAGLWADENCYWSASYSESREKFVALGNRLKEQVLEAKNGDNQGVLDVLDVQSLSYDISIAHEDYPAYIKSFLKVNDVFSSQTSVPETDTIDAILLTTRISGSNRNTGEGVNIIHSSGTHGVEGYIGSAVQIRFLHELFLANEEQLGSKTASSGDRVRRVLLIHAINPFGMRHHRRANENNVDLNRNVLSEQMWSHIRQRDPNFVGYVDMDSELNPFAAKDGNGRLFSWVDAARNGGFHGDVAKLRQQDEKVKNAVDESNYSPQKHIAASLKEPKNTFNSWLDEKKDVLGAIGKVISSLIRLGYTTGKRAMVASQYHKPSGVFYGGGAHNNNKWENSVFAVQHAISEFAGFDQFNSSSNRTIWIDVHTGLGKYAEYSILVKGDGGDISSQPTGQLHTWASKFTSLLEESGMSSNDESVSAGYDQTIGFINDSILCPPPNCFPLTQEFGTRPGPAIAVALILENMGYHSAGRKYGHLTSWAFYPQRLSWRRKTLQGGMEMLHASLDF
ncbi:hypothetical protein ACHAXR_010016 [Thalassiosira sp. AJA248-18]